MKTKELKRGVSLIVLVITIIVMVILAGVIILTLDNSGIINKAQDAVDQANLSEVKNVAQLAWAEAFLDGKTTQEELEQAVMDALAEQNITEEHYKGYTIEVTTSGVSFVESDGENNDNEVANSVNHSGIIPEGGTYITGGYVPEMDGTSNYIARFNAANVVTYTAGQQMPENPQPYDIYRYGDYTYIYNVTYDDIPYYHPFEELGWQYAPSNYEGWLVTIRQETPNGTDSDKQYRLIKETYGTILETINNKNVVNIEYIFYMMESEGYVFTVPEIPDTITMGRDGMY